MPTMKYFRSGTPELDKALGGGLRSTEIFQIYGSGGVGKTTLALQFAIATAKSGFQVFYVNTEGKFPIIRLNQLSGADFKKITPLINVVSPTNFNNQAQMVSQFESLIPSGTRLIIFDTIVSLYRKELGESSENLILNRKLNQQLGMIANFAISRSVAVILINQVRGNIEGENDFLPVADSITSYWSTYSLQISRTESKGYREFKLFRSQDSEPLTLVLQLQKSGFR
ncbi:MAG: ATPase domain-containing protein [Candidatus Hermodarchaeota archaeon]